MRFKGTFLLLIIALAFGSYLYFYEFKGSEQREKEKLAKNQIWTLQGKSILRIDLISPDLHIAAERKGENEWTLRSPQTWEGDSAELNSLADSAANLLRENIIESEAADLTKFGLNPARSGLRLKTKEGKEYAIDFGINNPAGTFTYALIPGKKEVFLVTAAAAGSFIKKIEDLRNHTILNFEPREVQSLSLKTPKGNIELIKDSADRWWFKRPEKRAADAPQVRGILNALSMGKIKEFFNNPTENYINPGIDGSIIDASLTYGPNTASKRLLIGTEKAKLRQKASAKTNSADKPAADSISASLYLAKDESRPDIFFVEKDLVDKLLLSPNDVRDKALASFQRWDVDSMILINSNGTFHFAKSGGEWFLGAAKKAKWDAINGLMDALEKPVKEWIDAPASNSSYGTDKPAIRIILKMGTTVLIDCSLGKAARDGIYAQIAGDPSIKVADPEGLHLLNRTESDFLEASVENPSQKKK
jgi:hypothetical protein